MKNFNSLSRTSKYPILFLFYSELKKFNNINPQKEHRNEKKAVYNNATELYNEYLEVSIFI